MAGVTEVESAIGPGSIVVVRDEEWLVTQIEPASDGEFVHVQGLSELVRETDAIFSTALDDIVPLDPAQAEVVADDSPNYRRARLWLESTLRKTAVPLTDLQVMHMWSSSKSKLVRWPLSANT